MSPGLAASRWLSGLAVALVVGLLATRAATGELNELRFNADAEAYLMETYAWAHQGRLPERGVLNVPLGLDLGPLYLAALVPVSWLSPSPRAVHVFNATLFLAGLLVFVAGFRHRAGVAPPLAVALLYGVSEQHAVLMEVAYHVGAIPGVLCAWFGCAAGWAATRKTRWLVGGALCLAGLAQLHPLTAVYGVGGLLLLLSTRASLGRPQVVASAATFVVALAPLLIYLLPTLGNAGTSALHQGDAPAHELRLPEALYGLVEMSGARWGLSPWSAVVVLVLAVLGATGSRQDPLARSFTLSAALGLPAVAFALSFESSGRYFLAVVPALFALATLGLERLALTPLRSAWVLAALAALRLVAPPPAELAGPAQRDTLSAGEQEAAVEALAVRRGLGWWALAGRAHGPLFGAESGVRYLELASRPRRGPEQAGGADLNWVVRTGDLPPPRVVSAESLGSPAGRPLTLYTTRRAFDPAALKAAGRPCPHVLPFVWVPLDALFLKSLGFPGHGPDIHRCLAWGQGLSIPTEPGETLVVELADEGTFRGSPAGVELSSGGQALEPQVLQLSDRTRYTVTLPARSRGLTLRPLAKRLVYADVY